VSYHDVSGTDSPFRELPILKWIVMRGIGVDNGRGVNGEKW